MYIKIMKMRYTIFLEDEVIRRSTVPREIRLKEKRVCVPTSMVAKPFFSVPATVTPIVQGIVVVKLIIESPVPMAATPIVVLWWQKLMKKRNMFFENLLPIMRSNNSLIYRMCHIMNHLEDLRGTEGQLSLKTIRFMLAKKFKWRVISPLFEEAMRSAHSSKWLEAMEDEMRSMSTNRVCDLEEISKGAKIVGCKWVYKTKCDSKGNIERFKAQLLAKGFTQREGIDYTEIFTPISCKDSLRIIMALVVHYDLELHQMDVKTAFLNRDLLENVYMTQLKGFVVKGKQHTRWHLKKSIYELKQASSQWYLKFDEIIRRFGFKENEEDYCIYAKFRSGKFIFLILYVDDILLASSDVSLLLETKMFLFSNFDIKDLGEASFILGIEIHRGRRNEVLGLS
jgi:hypothetical protein